MKAMVLKEFGKPLELMDLPIPDIGPKEVLIKVSFCGLCGTDLKIAAGKIASVKTPLIMGHEPTGIIEKVGSEVSNVKPGDHVATALYVTCGICDFCRTNQDTLCVNLVGRPGFEFDGGFSEYLRLPATNVLKISSKIPLSHAALLTDCLATDWHAVWRKAKPKPGDNVMIMGTGGLGVNAIQFVKMIGANVIGVDVVQEKLNLAKQYGADIIINASSNDLVGEINKITNFLGVDAVLEFVGTPVSMENSIRCLKRGGKIVLIGYSPGNPFFADSVDIVHAEKNIIGSRANTKYDLMEVIRFLEKGLIKPIITNEYELENTNTALDDLKNNKIIGRSIIKVN